jgi:uncharacterized membrane protein YbhN (UPF0104 family)
MSWNRYTAYFFVFFSLALTVAMLWYVSLNQTLDGFFTMLRRIELGYFWVYLGLNLCGLFCRAFRYYWLIGLMGVNEIRASFFQLTIVTMCRNALVDLLPARLGELSFFGLLKAYGIKLSLVFSAFSICFVLDVLVIGILFSAVLISNFLQASGDDAGWLLSSAIIGGMSLCSLLVLVYAVPLASLAQRIINYLSSLNWISTFPRACRALYALDNFCGRVVKDLSLLSGFKAYAVLVLVTCGQRTAKYSSLYVLLLAILSQFGLEFGDVPFGLSLVAFVSAEGAASLPISGIMGFGAYEAVWIGVLRTGGVNLVQDSSVILGVHLITQVVGYAIGSLGLLLFLTHYIKFKRWRFW